MRHLLYIVPLLTALLALDRLVTRGGTSGWERNCVLDAQRRWRGAAGRGAVLLGSSTSADWLPRELLASQLGLAPPDVVDAHINGCHQDCSWAQVRQLLAEGRHYRSALYGTNQFQLCEHEHSKRVLHQRMLVPARDVGRLIWHYRRGDEPLTYVTRLFGGALFETYADTAVLQARWAQALFGGGRPGAAHRWHRRAAPPAGWSPLCGYRPQQVRYKLGYAEALLDDLGQLADQVYLLLLPDEHLSRDEPAVRQAWEAHRALHRQLARRRPFVRLIDLATDDGARLRSHFRDGVHVSAAGAELQRALFQRQLARPPARGPRR